MSNSRRRSRKQHSIEIYVQYYSHRNAVLRALLRELGPLAVLVIVALIGVAVYLTRHADPWLATVIILALLVWIVRRLVRAGHVLDEFFSLHLGEYYRSARRDRNDDDPPDGDHRPDS